MRDRAAVIECYKTEINADRTMQRYYAVVSEFVPDEIILPTLSDLFGLEKEKVVHILNDVSDYGRKYLDAVRRRANRRIEEEAFAVARYEVIKRKRR